MNSPVDNYRHIADHAWLTARSLFVAEGRLVVRRLIELQRWPIESLLLTQPAADSLADILPRVTAPTFIVEQAMMNEVVGFNIHRGCLALAQRGAAAPFAADATARLTRVLVLEGVNNPDNTGGLFRTAAAFGVELVVIGPDCADPLYRKSIRTSMGATLVVPFVTTPQWPQAIGDLRSAGFAVVALTPEAAALPLDAAPRGGRIALLVGSEGAGLTADALAASTTTARIPMAPGIDSLNVTTAASIAMYHAFAERRQ